MNEKHAPEAAQIEWSQTLCDGRRVSFAEAERAVAELGEGWKIPDRWQQESSLDLSRFDPAVDPALHPDIRSEPYWTSTPYAPDPSCAWVVLFCYGGVDAYYRGHYRACVRACRVVPAGQ